MRIDFSDSLVFEDNEVLFDKNINFIFGNNGTGKSTIARFLQEQSDERDVRVFQGFQSVVGENKELNAVVLGDENLEINKKIQIKEDLIQEKESDLENVTKQITESEEVNIYTRKKEKEKEFNKKEREIHNFFRKAGAEIKNSIKDYKIAVDMAQLVNLLSLRLIKVIARYGKKYSPLDILLLKIIYRHHK